MTILRDRRGTVAAIDVNSAALACIDTAHKRIHDGTFFSAEVQDVSLADNNFLDMLIVVPENTYPHVHFTATFTAQTRTYLYEATQSVPASPEDERPAYNRNRNRLDNAATKFYANPVISSPLGTLLYDVEQPGGSRFRAFGGTAETFMEWVLRPNTSYLARLENTSGAAESASLQVDFYEDGAGV